MPRSNSLRECAGNVRLHDRVSHADVFYPKGSHLPCDLLERIRVLLIRKRGPKRPPAFPVMASSA